MWERKDIEYPHRNRVRKANSHLELMLAKGVSKTQRVFLSTLSGEGRIRIEWAHCLVGQGT